MSAEIGIRIRKMREFRNYTQNYMADKLNLSQNMYSKIENGQAPITTDRLEQIAKTLDVPLENIINKEYPIYNIDNKNTGNVYGNIGTLHEENKETMQQTINLLKEELHYMKDQNTLLLQTIVAMGKER